MPGNLYIIAAASGTGKTTLVRSLCKKIEKLEVSVSYTTRPQRTGEVNGVDYHFVTKEKFQEMIVNHQFLEHKVVFENLYGTPRQWVDLKLADGIDIILEIDWQGAQEIRRNLPERNISIFVLPPSFASLEQRLRGRGQDDDTIIQHRMQCALGELAHYDEFDYLVINKDLDRTVAEMEQIILCHRQGKSYTGPDHRAFAEQLVAEGKNVP